MRYTYVLLLLPLIFVSCEEAILGDFPANDPESVFELFWDDFDKHYSLFIERDVNWDSLYTVYRPQVTATTTEEELWIICTNLLEHLDDGHTFMRKYNPLETFVSGGQTLNQQSEQEFSTNLVRSEYLATTTDLPSEDIFYGKLRDKDIGYIYLAHQSGSDASMIDQVIDVLKIHKAIIVDIRQNAGGSAYYAARIAGVFADSEQLIYTSATRNGKNHDDFNTPTEFYSQKAGDEQYLKPVIVLTDRGTISAGELFLLHIKAFAHVTQIGTTTSGDFGRTSNRRFLPNGWTYRYSVGRVLLPDGQNIDGIGCIPNVYIKNTIGDIAANNDKVLEKAIDYLWTTYGIE
ncbi:MAG: S41 family peptidase [Bacteroidota bacterium]